MYINKILCTAQFSQINLVSIVFFEFILLIFSKISSKIEQIIINRNKQIKFLKMHLIKILKRRVKLVKRLH